MRSLGALGLPDLTMPDGENAAHPVQPIGPCTTADAASRDRNASWLSLSADRPPSALQHHAIIPMPHCGPETRGPETALLQGEHQGGRDHSHLSAGRMIAERMPNERSQTEASKVMLSWCPKQGSPIRTWLSQTRRKKSTRRGAKFGRSDEVTAVTLHVTKSWPLFGMSRELGERSSQEVDIGVQWFSQIRFLVLSSTTRLCQTLARHNAHITPLESPVGSPARGTTPHCELS